MGEVHAVVTGRVQGVGFRSWTRRAAQTLGLAGWVRNLPDGSVETVARGPEETLDRFLDALREGPPLSVVDEVRFRMGDTGEERFDNFSVRW